MTGVQTCALPISSLLSPDVGVDLAKVDNLRVGEVVVLPDDLCRLLQVSLNDVANGDTAVSKEVYKVTRSSSTDASQCDVCPSDVAISPSITLATLAYR